MQVEASMPLKTVIPMERRAAAPAPVANTRGSTPRMKAIDVITIGRKRVRAASTAAASMASPSSSRSSRANSTMRIAFLLDSAISRTRPIWV